MPLKRRSFTLAAVCSPLAAFANVDEFPSKPIRIVMPLAAGQSGDVILRALAEPMTRDFKVPVVIDNKPGANGFIAAQSAAGAPPDGYTLFLGSGQTHGANSAMFKKVPYDPVADFAPVLLLNKGSLVFVAPAGGPIKTAQDLLRLAKQKPDGLVYGAASAGTRMSVELLQKMAGVKMRYVPYKAAPQAVTEMMGGNLDFVVADPPTVQGLIQQGRIIGLAVTTTQRHPTLPEVPTWAESGMPGFEMFAWAGVFAPAGTPPAVIDKLNAMFRQALASPAGKAFYDRAGLRASPSTPQELRAMVTSEITKWSNLVKFAGIEPE